MHPIYNTYKPDGFSTVSPYLMVANPLELIEFLKSAFHAEELDRTLHPETGAIANCIMKIGDACFMIGQPMDPSMEMRTSFYLYVNDVDAMHKRAVEHGAKEVFPPTDMDYEDRQSGVIGPAGNYWWISKRLVEKGYAE